MVFDYVIIHQTKKIKTLWCSIRLGPAQDTPFTLIIWYVAETIYLLFCLLQLVELIPRRPKKLNIKKSSVGEPLEKFWSLSSVTPPFLDCLRRQRAANLIRLV